MIEEAEGEEEGTALLLNSVVRGEGCEGVDVISRRIVNSVAPNYVA